MTNGTQQFKATNTNTCFNLNSDFRKGKVNMNTNVSRVLLSLVMFALLYLSFKALFKVQLHQLGKEVSRDLKEEIYKDFIDKFAEEIDKIIEKIETETIPILKNNEQLNSSLEVEKWSMSIQGRKVTNTMAMPLHMVENVSIGTNIRCSPKMTRTVQ